MAFPHIVVAVIIFVSLIICHGQALRLYVNHITHRLTYKLTAKLFYNLQITQIVVHAVPSGIALQNDNETTLTVPFIVWRQRAKGGLQASCLAEPGGHVRTCSLVARITNSKCDG